MNKALLETIVKHVFANFMVVPSTHVNVGKSKSFTDKEWLLHDQIPFDVEGSDQVQKNHVWGCQISADQQEVKVLLGDCTEDKNFPEYALIVHLKDSPTYGLYLVNNSNDIQVSTDPMIAVTMDGKDWLQCSTFLQATFLAGMEQIREVGLAWSKCTNYKSEFDMLVSFINFHHSIYGEKE
jgi:hypothetical protein